MKKEILLFVVFLATFFVGRAQFLMDIVDTSREMSRGMLLMNKKLDFVKFSGYIQPQFQLISQKGAQTYEGGDFSTYSDNRFMIRRGRIRFDYVHFSADHRPSVQFVFQFDGTERGVAIRDFWGCILENKFKLLSFTAGMFARPFGYEINLASSVRESPERGRMSQILMKSERDLGAMVSINNQKNSVGISKLKMDIGFFNGQGLAATTDFDSKKDLVARVSTKPILLSNKIRFSTGASLLYGGMLQNTPYVYHMHLAGGTKLFIIDSSLSNKGKIAPRQYYGIDAQLKIKNKNDETELRGEFISGNQTGTAFSSETPASLLKLSEGHYIRKFNGAYFYLLHSMFNKKHQFGLKYDWYDPNTTVKGLEIGKTGTNLSAADIKYITLGCGYIYYVTDNLKLMIWYDEVKNETTQLPGYMSDIKDNVLTVRMQFRF